MDVNEFKPHSKKQEDALFSQAKITGVITGLQWGKTTVGAVWLRMLTHMYTDPQDNFIITAPNYKIMQQSTLPAFLKVMEGCGKYNKVEASFDINGGGTIYMRTATDPDSVVGVTNVRGIWGDEAGKYGLYFWENIQGRASFRDCPIILTTTPYTLNWMYKELVKGVQQGKRPDVNLIRASSNENPYFSKGEFERRKLTMDPRRFAMMYGGSFERAQGLVYDCFDPDINICPVTVLPSGTRFFAGVDWGTTHPFVIVVRAITPDGRHYQVAEFYKTGTSLSDYITAAGNLKRTWNIEMFYCDPAQPGYIMEFNKNGLPAVGAKNDIMHGVGKHYELIKLGKYKIFEGTSPYTLDELETYHYAEPDDALPDKDIKERKPVDQDNHSMDANRYCTMGTLSIGDIHKPRLPNEVPKEETLEQKFKRLHRKNNQTWEKWS